MVVKSRAYEEERIRRIRQKYGVNAFRIWGREGGNPILNAVHRGYKVTIRKPSHKRR